MYAQNQPVCAIIERRNDKAAQVYHHQMPPLTTAKDKFAMATSDRTDSPIQIQISDGNVVSIDAVDSDLADIHWYACGHRYAHRIIWKDDKRVSELLHRTILSRILGRPLGLHENVDHIDGNGFNNCRENLRSASQAENSCNAKIHSNNVSGYKGVYRSKNPRLTKRPWIAEIKQHGVKHSLGNFASAEEAHEKYCAATRELFGEFAPSYERTKRS